MKKVFCALFLSLFLFSSCDDMFNPAPQNNRDIDAVIAEPAFAQGLLGQAYLFIPYNAWSAGTFETGFTEVATDDAVHNQTGNIWRRIATGEWTPITSPMNSNWQDWRGIVQYLNFFLSLADQIMWANDEATHGLFRDRMVGDAHGMRALYHFHLLRTTAGFAPDGQLLAFPLVLEPEDVHSNFNVPRSTFREVVEQIRRDVAVAQRYLPVFKGEATVVPPHLAAQGVTLPQYNRVFGRTALGRMNGQIADVVLAQTLLFAASPAFAASGITWEEAAHQFHHVLTRIAGNSANPLPYADNPLAGLDPQGHRWFNNTGMLSTTGGGANPPEVIWRGNMNNGHYIARAQLPPTMHGRGRVNPTRNFVDAFPMASGLPITDPASGFDPQNPYANRDPRLQMNVIHNGMTITPGNVLIETRIDGPNENALNRATNSTRTGYYLRRHIHPNMNPNPSAISNQPNFVPWMRYTEMFLGFAEAANEAWGPMDNRLGFSAYEVVRAIRARAGVGVVVDGTRTDPFLESIRTDQDAMRELIRNERRLELAFEGHRFWDLRRWGLPLDEPARGTEIRMVEGTLEHTVILVEDRTFTPHQRFAPLPNSEILKFPALQQNSGW